MAARLVGDDAEEVQRVGMVGLHGEDLAVKGLGVRQPPGLVVPESKFKGLLTCHGRGEGCSAHQRCHMAR